MRRALFALLLVGCGYKHGTVPGDGGDAPMVDAVDAPPIQAMHVRPVDIANTEVIGGPHTDFPLLVRLSASWLRTTDAGGDVTSSNGFDVRFSANPEGTMPLAHEIEAYRGAVGDLVAWVKVTSLESTTVIYIHYGDPSITTSQENAAAVWSNGFATVWHLASDLHDSTMHIQPGTNSGSVEAGGTIEAARSFDGANDVVNFGSTSVVDDVFTGGGTVEAWIRPTTFGEASRGRIFDKGDAAVSTGTAGWMLSVDNINVASSLLFGRGATTGDGFWNTPAQSVALGMWTHVAVVYDQSNTANAPRMYVNGRATQVSVLAQISGTVLAEDSYDLVIGTRPAGDRTFDGLLDELRMSKVARSDGWIETAYRNQFDPNAFYTVGAEL